MLVSMSVGLPTDLSAETRGTCEGTYDGVNLGKTPYAVTSPQYVKHNTQASVRTEEG